MGGGGGNCVNAVESANKSTKIQNLFVNKLVYAQNALQIKVWPTYVYICVYTGFPTHTHIQLCTHWLAKLFAQLSKLDLISLEHSFCPLFTLSPNYIFQCFLTDL